MFLNAGDSEDNDINIYPFISVKGNNKISRQQILKLAEVQKGDNIFMMTNNENVDLIFETYKEEIDKAVKENIEIYIISTLNTEVN